MGYEIKLDWGSERMSHYFIIINYDKKTLYDTSVLISDLLDIDLDEYNEKVINEVVKNKNYSIYRGSSSGRRLYKDLTFEADKEEEVYIERFKDVFVKELTLLSLGGEDGNKNF